MSGKSILILVLVLVYLFAVVLGIGVRELRRRQGAKDEFALAGKSMGLWEVGLTSGLAILGAVHVLGYFEMSWFVGAAVLWFSIGCALALAVVSATTGRWARGLGVSTAYELVGVATGSRALGVVAVCVGAPLIWGVLTLETQGLGIVLSALTGLPLQYAVMLGAVIGILYVFLAGMKQIARLNLINTGVLYVGGVVSALYLGFVLPRGWSGVSEFYLSQNQAWALSIMGAPGTLVSFGLVNVLALVLFHLSNQFLLQPMLSAESVRTVRNAMWIAVPINAAFGVFTCAIGLAAKTQPQFASLGAKLAAPSMLVAMLPWWLCAWLLASFMLVILSTFSITCLAPATAFVKDIYVNLRRPDASEREVERAIRLVMLLLAVAAVIPSMTLPPIVAAILWLYAWSVPVTVFVILGLFWKRSPVAAAITWAVAWIANALWTFTGLSAALGLSSLPGIYVVLLVSIVLGIVLTAACQGEPGYFTSRRQANIGRAASGDL
ncbi:MAG: sodium:solute symporter family protein [Moorellales bacterium]